MALPLLGANFSHRQAEWFGLDPDETFTLLLDDLRVRIFRMSLYWDEIQPEPTRYDFSTIQRKLDRAETRRARVLITVGLKAQRHPWFYPPAWLVERGTPRGGPISDQKRLIAHLLLMLERVVAMLADFGCIDSWQVEDEPFLRDAGSASGWVIDDRTLEKEISAVAGSDPRHRPIVVNHSSNTLWEMGWLKALKLADVLGRDVYPYRPSRYGPHRYGSPFALGPLGPGLFVQSTLAHRFGRQFWVTELQSEPWQTTSHSDLQTLEIDRISPDQIEVNLATVSRARPDRVYFQGAEWWRHQALQGDDRYWRLARRLFHEQLERVI